MSKALTAIREKIEVPDAKVLSNTLEVNGEPTSVKDFLYFNLCDPDTDHISIGQAKDVLNMNVGETVYIGHSEVTRTK